MNCMVLCTHVSYEVLLQKWKLWVFVQPNCAYLNLDSFASIKTPLFVCLWFLNFSSGYYFCKQYANTLHLETTELQHEIMFDIRRLYIHTQNPVFDLTCFHITY